MLITYTTLNVLGELTSVPLLGRELIRMGVLRRGSAYVRLTRMEDAGLITGTSNADGSRGYTITDKGSEAYKRGVATIVRISLGLALIGLVITAASCCWVLATKTRPLNVIGAGVGLGISLPSIWAIVHAYYRWFLRRPRS